MDSKKFADLIQAPYELQHLQAEEIETLTQHHPYFAGAQLLQWGFDYFRDQENLSKAALYKSDPVLFAQFYQLVKKSKSETTTPVKPADHTLSVTDNPIPEVEVTITDETAKVPLVDAIPDTTTKQEISYTPAKEALDQPIQSAPHEPVLATTSVPENENKVEDKATDKAHSDIQEIDASNEITEKDILLKKEEDEEDILTIISNLPNSNVLEEKNTPQTKIPPVEPALSAEEKIEKSLMVMMSFTEWLQYFKTKTQQEKEEAAEKKALKSAWQKQKLTAIIEEEDDEIPENIFKQAMDSISMGDTLISESLAEILAKQGKTDKAIEMYKKLSLRNPEKNTYFADRIKDLLTNNI